MVLLLLATACWAFPNEPEGFGKARFGMTLSELQGAYPGLTRVPADGRSAFPSSAQGRSLPHDSLGGRGIGSHLC